MKFHQRLQTKGVFCCHCYEDERNQVLKVGIFISNGQQNNPVNVFDPDSKERFILVVPEGSNFLFNLELPFYEKICV